MEVGILGLLVDDPVDVRGGMLLDCMGLRAVPAHCPELGTNPQRARRNSREPLRSIPGISYKAFGM